MSIDTLSDIPIFAKAYHYRHQPQAPWLACWPYRLNIWMLMLRCGNSSDLELLHLLMVGVEHLVEGTISRADVNITTNEIAAGFRQLKHLQRSTLTKPKPTWWPASAREGLSIRPLSDDEVSDMMERHRYWISSEYSFFSLMVLVWMAASQANDGGPLSIAKNTKALLWHLCRA
jgi:hypothetical protein